MEIKLNQILPLPLAHRDLNQSDVWSKQLCLNSSFKYHVVAPSGSGKSTLIGVLYGLRTDYTGSLNMGMLGTDFANIRKDAIGVVLQDMRLLEQYTVLDNIQLKNQIHQHFDAAQIDDMLNRLGIKELKDKKVAVLSEGEKQRVAIIRALSMPFKFLLLDEPFSHLDDYNAKLAAALILEEVNKNEAGLLMANLRKDDYFQYDKYFAL